MPAFNPELIAIMRAALEQAMTKVPPAKATSAIKAHLAQSILRAAAQGETSEQGFVTAAADELPIILSLFTPVDRPLQRPSHSPA
jgi:hypothetical protein